MTEVTKLAIYGDMAKQDSSFEDCFADYELAKCEDDEDQDCVEFIIEDATRVYEGNDSNPQLGIEYVPGKATNPYINLNFHNSFEIEVDEFYEGGVYATLTPDYGRSNTYELLEGLSKYWVFLEEESAILDVELSCEAYESFHQLVATCEDDDDCEDKYCIGAVCKECRDYSDCEELYGDGNWECEYGDCVTADF